MHTHYGDSHDERTDALRPPPTTACVDRHAELECQAQRSYRAPIDGIDTGIKLNGLTDEGLDTITVAGVPNNWDQILEALEADSQLVGTVIDAESTDTNTAGFPATSNTSLQLFGLRKR